MGDAKQDPFKTLLNRLRSDLRERSDRATESLWTVVEAYAGGHTSFTAFLADVQAATARVEEERTDLALVETLLSGKKLALDSRLSTLLRLVGPKTAPASSPSPSPKPTPAPSPKPSPSPSPSPVVEADPDSDQKLGG